MRFKVKVMCDRKEIIPIVCCSSEEYLELTLVMVWSIMKSARKNLIYEIIIIHNKIPYDKQSWLQESVKKWNNCKITFMDIQQQKIPKDIKTAKWNDRLPCISLLAFDILKIYDKIIMLDIDLIVRKDIAELYQISLHENWLAAALDIDFNGQWKRRKRSYTRYYKKEVILTDPEHYIQSGVIVANLKKIRENFPDYYFIRLALSKKFLYDDQDILNLCCANHILIIKQNWNVLHDNNCCRIRYVVAFANRDLREEYFEARTNPFIIHYAGNQKPWNDNTCDFAKEYWNIAYDTPIYEMLNSRLSYKFRNKRIRCMIRKCYHELVRLIDLMKNKIWF